MVLKDTDDCSKARTLEKNQVCFVGQMASLKAYNKARRIKLGNFKLFFEGVIMFHNFWSEWPAPLCTHKFWPIGNEAVSDVTTQQQPFVLIKRR